MPKYLQIRHEFIGQELFALERCFTTQNECNRYNLQVINWNNTICHLYIAYDQILHDYPVEKKSELTCASEAEDLTMNLPLTLTDLGSSTYSFQYLSNCQLILFLRTLDECLVDVH
jgi:hypothetical protein